MRDQRRKQRLESALMLRKAREEAEEEVRREEREARERAAREEKLVDLQVALMRGQLRERQRAIRQLAEKQRLAIEREIKNKEEVGGKNGKKALNEPKAKLILLESSPVVLKAEEIVASERRRQQTRSELIQQLEEAGARELKEDIRLLHRSFCAWYECVVSRRARLGKAVAVREWRLLVRAWGGWRKVVVDARARALRDVATREMQRQKR